ncbi:hypothetical protein L3N51_01873 [Metallosphaera sp. J1]|uniref:hypothetical protein n=1 Tax=Metallosphaera javensis (ex Hofmann et al. 2022) TaxID=99938 RepID=UPI001EE08796|nr:hypothetical protein [Metallosphaera javensis (ex Hofmann et al. 2022)]MCG3109578.1 hypothetical protein [Metallosphaera javensis (ex Hofmann et al. 2022)]
MSIKHLRVDIEVNKPLVVTQDIIEKSAREVFNLDLHPVLIDKDNVVIVSLRLNRDSPVKGMDTKRCEDFLPFIFKLIRDLSLAWQVVRLYETVTYEPEGAVADGVVGGTVGSTSKKPEVVLLLAVFGGLVGYLLGDVNERLSKDLCEFRNMDGIPVVYHYADLLNY